MPANITKAVHELAYALKIESGPSTRNACQDALSSIMGIQYISNTELQMLYDITGEL